MNLDYYYQSVRNRKVISDLDNTLVDIVTPLLRIMTNVLSFKNIIEKENLLNNWYLKKDYNIENWFPEKIHEDIWKYYTENNKFYDNLIPNNLFCFVSKASENNNLHIISKCLDGPVIESKKRFLKKWFPKAKIDIIPMNESKTKYFDESEKQGIYLEDNLKEIKNAIEIYPDLTVLMPEYGYNRDFENKQVIHLKR